MTIKEKGSLLFVFCLIFAGYLLTMPGQLTLEDDGLFLMASYYAGIPQPPGYPLYSLLGNIIASIPVATVPVRIHAMSAFFGAATCIAMAVFMCQLIPSFTIALITALTFAASRIFWSQSIIAEVYTLNAFLLFMLLFLICKSKKLIGEVTEQDSKNSLKIKYLLAGTFFIFGLSFTVHLPVMLVSLPAFLILLWPVRKRLFEYQAYLGSFFILGLTPYGWMIWRTHTDVLINFYGPIQSLTDFLFFIFREGYVAVDVSNAAGLKDKFDYIIYLLSESVTQYFWPSYFFIVVGFITQWCKWPRHIFYSILVLFLANSFLFLFVIYFDYDLLSRSVFSVYPIISYAVLAIWMGAGLYQSISWLHKRFNMVLSKELTILIVGSFLIAFTMHQNFEFNNRHNYRWAGDYAKQVLTHLPEDAVLFVSGDIPSFTIGYTHHVKGLRGDINIYDLGGLVYSNRLFNPGKSSQAEKLHAIESFVNNSRHNICTSDKIIPTQPQVDYWLFSCFSNNTEQIYRTKLTPELIKYYGEILKQDNHTDVWTVHHRQQLIKKMGVLLGKLLMQKNDQNSDISEFTDATLGMFHGALGYLEGKMMYDLKDNDINEMISVITNTQFIPELTRKIDKGSLFHIRGYVSERAGNLEHAITEYETSLKFWPKKQNPAINRLLKLYKFKDNTEDYKRILDNFY